MKIRKNIGTVDRSIRVVLGTASLALVPLAAVGLLPGWAFLGALGLVPLVAGLVGTCPPYALLGINTAGGGGTAPTRRGVS